MEKRKKVNSGKVLRLRIDFLQGRYVAMEKEEPFPIYFLHLVDAQSS